MATEVTSKVSPGAAVSLASTLIWIDLLMAPTGALLSRNEIHAQIVDFAGGERGTRTLDLGIMRSRGSGKAMNFRGIPRTAIFKSPLLSVCFRERTVKSARNVTRSLFATPAAGYRKTGVRFAPRTSPCAYAARCLRRRVGPISTSADM